MNNTPPPLEMAKNFAQGMVEWAGDGFKMQPEAETARRLKICEECKDHKDGRCMLCGCFLKVKAALSTGKCPVGKWHPEEPA